MAGSNDQYYVFVCSHLVKIYFYFGFFNKLSILYKICTKFTAALIIRGRADCKLFSIVQSSSSVYVTETKKSCIKLSQTFGYNERSNWEELFVSVSHASTNETCKARKNGKS